MVVGIIKSVTVGIECILYFMVIPRHTINLNLKEIGWRHVKTYLKITTPAGLSSFFGLFVKEAMFIVAGWMTNKFSIQALTIMLSVVNLELDASFGFGLAVAPLVGKYVGRQRQNLAK